MDEDLLSLAFAIHRNPGGYALLVGSGVSSGAGVPTGWGITLDLAHQVAAAEGAEPDDLSAWFEEATGHTLEYSDAIERLARTPDERRHLLKGYFEPTDEERERGVKVPSQAHRAIANLVASGFVRIVITTNFDRLLEDAIREAGVTPVVIATADAAKGAPPIAQAQALVLKVHGDYIDARIKNTSAELDVYEQDMDALLDRILDEFGLVIVGWSATWDPALRRALERSQSRRFSWYWARRGELDAAASQLVHQQECIELTITDADDFFFVLSRRIEALDRVRRSTPLAVETVTAEFKSLVSRGDEIGLHDLVHEIQEGLVSRMQAPGYHLMREYSDEELLRSVGQYEADAELAVALAVSGCRWWSGDPGIWMRLLERLGNLSRGDGSLREVWAHLTRYPAMQILYAGGLGAIAGERWSLLHSILTRPQEYDLAGRQFPLILYLDSSNVLQRDRARKLPEMERRKTPLNDRLHANLRDPLRGLLPAERDFEQAFDMFEYLLIGSSYHVRQTLGRSGWMPPARLLWKEEYGLETGARARMNPETGAGGRLEALLAAGFFDGSEETWAAAHAAIVQMAEQYAF